MISNKVNITNIKSLLTGARVLMRVDYNCPLDSSKNVTDAGRIEATIPTIKKILACKPKSLVLMSHLGRPGGERNKLFSLKPCLPVLSKLINKPVTFMDDCIGDKV
jgi:phosphoglycerate kinase